jgi:hypothetical protein
VLRGQARSTLCKNPSRLRAVSQPPGCRLAMATALLEAEEPKFPSDSLSSSPSLLPFGAEGSKNKKNALLDRSCMGKPRVIGFLTINKSVLERKTIRVMAPQIRENHTLAYTSPPQIRVNASRGRRSVKMRFYYAPKCKNDHSSQSPPPRREGRQLPPSPSRS